MATPFLIVTSALASLPFPVTVVSGILLKVECPTPGVYPTPVEHEEYQWQHQRWQHIYQNPSVPR